MKRTIDKDAMLADLRKKRGNPHNSAIERSMYDEMLKYVGEFGETVEKISHAESFPELLEVCNMCGFKYPHIISTVYMEDKACAYYICDKCKVVHEQRQFRRIRRDENGG